MVATRVRSHQENDGETVGAKNIKSPPGLSARQGQMGDGSAPGSLSRTGIRRAPLRGLPVSRRHSPRQAEFSAS